MKIFTEIPEQLTELILNCKRAVVCGHLNPDGDCANSVSAIGILLRTLGKQYILVNEGSFSRPEIADFEKKLTKEIPPEWLNKNTLGIIADCSTTDRLGHYAQDFEKLTTVVIDHHANGFKADNTKYIIPESPSATLLVYKLFRACNVEVNEEAARYLFRGFATDSGFFRFLGKGTEECFEIVSELVRKGINPAEEYSQMTGNRPLNSVKFLSTLIDRTESFFDGKLMLSHEEDTDRRIFGDNARSSDDLYAQLLSVKGVQAVAFLKKSNKVENAIEIGLRASHNSTIDVGKIASDRGGGGHVKAAGVTIIGTYPQVKELILSDFEKAFS